MKGGLRVFAEAGGPSEGVKVCCMCRFGFTKQTLKSSCGFPEFEEGRLVGYDGIREPFPTWSVFKVFISAEDNWQGP